LLVWRSILDSLVQVAPAVLFVGITLIAADIPTSFLDDGPTRSPIDRIFETFWV
jgi:hypothetical protein